MTLDSHSLLFLVGLVAGVIDSIAGGGGLVTVPAFTIVLGAGPQAIGSNKIAGAVAALVALIIYARKGHMDWSRGWSFTLCVGIGSLLGSTLNPYLPLSAFRWLMLGTCPVILWIVWKKDLWVAKEKEHELTHQPSLLLPLCGLACGFYDGLWGPGGGTFMFLSLLFIAKLPLFTALAIAKLANTCSATVSLINYQVNGYVHWPEGLWTAFGIAIGAIIGSLTATKRAAKIIRPILLVVVMLLIWKTMRD